MAFLPALSVIGFIGLGLTPTITVLMAFQVMRRAGNFAIARPAREVLFTVVSQEDRYKAKSFIDTVVYRLGDQVGAWTYGLAGALGLARSALPILAALVSLAWLVNALWLGRRQDQLAQEAPAPPVAGEAAPAHP